MWSIISDRLSSGTVKAVVLYTLFTAEQSRFKLMVKSYTYCCNVFQDGEELFRPLSCLHTWLSHQFTLGMADLHVVQICWCEFILDRGFAWGSVVFLYPRWTEKRLFTSRPPLSQWAGRPWTLWPSLWHHRLLLWTARPSKLTFLMRTLDLNTTQSCLQTQVWTQVWTRVKQVGFLLC